LGGVAQLGEHLLCKQGVVGSSPITSILPGPPRADAAPKEMEGKIPRRVLDGRDCIAEKRKQSALMVLCGTAMPLVSPVGGMLVFVRVNQVLVRLWACLLACLTGCAVLRGGRQRVGCVQRCCVHATGRDPVVLSEVESACTGFSRQSASRRKAGKKGLEPCLPSSED
jgi:hypothetical protein